MERRRSTRTKTEEEDTQHSSRSGLRKRTRLDDGTYMVAASGKMVVDDEEQDEEMEDQRQEQEQEQHGKDDSKQEEEEEEAGAKSLKDARNIILQRTKKNSSSSGATVIKRAPEFEKAIINVRTHLQKIRFVKWMIESYDRDGWKDSAHEKVKPEQEIEAEKRRMRKAKRKIREILRNLAEGEEAKKEWRLEKIDDDGIDFSNIFCSKCYYDDTIDDAIKNANDESNDILLCDVEGCNRAFHQNCCVPPVSPEEMEQDDWFCRRCTCIFECLNMINDHMGTDHDVWQEVFPPEELEKEELASKLEQKAKNGRVSRRGRKIKTPKNKASSGGGGGGGPSRGAWDTHSFASETDDEDFGSQSSRSSSSSSSSRSSGEEDDEEEDEEEEDGDGEGVGSDDDDNPLILHYKRDRKKVDYVQMAAKMFHEEENDQPTGKENKDLDFKEGDDGKLDLNASLKDLYND